MIVIDTHALVWAIEGDDRLGQRSIALIDDERVRDSVGVAPITVWEAGMLIAKNRLALKQPIGGWFDAVLSAPGFVLLPLTVKMAIDAGTLSDGLHGDPADRLIIATARALGCPVLTADEKILAYARAGHLEAIDAGR